MTFPCIFPICVSVPYLSVYGIFLHIMHAQEYGQRSDTTRTLLTMRRGKTETPIEGAGVLAGGQVLVSLSEGTVTIPSRNSADTVLVQSLG